MYKDNNFLDKTFYKFLFPTILSVLGGTVNIMVDSIIVGNTLGERGLAAITLCSPLYLFMCTLGSLPASGSAILSSISLGKNKENQSNEYYTIAFFMMIAVSVVFTAVAILFIDDIVSLLGANAETYQYVKDYAVVIILGAIGKILLYLPFYYLRLDGKTMVVSLLLVGMTLTNGALDLFFIVVLDQGMAGAAWASVIATNIAAVIGFMYLIRGSFKFCFNKINDFLRKTIDISKYGSTLAINNFTTTLRIIYLNIILVGSGGNAFIFVFAVVNILSELSLCLINGIPQTASPIIGVYHGEKDTSSIRVLLKKQFIIGVPLAIFFAVIIVLFYGQIGKLFGLQGDFDTLFTAIVFLAISIPFAMINSIFTYFYSTTGRILISNIITVCRVFLFTVVFAYLLSHDTTFVWFFFVIAELITLVVTFVLAFIMKRRNKKLSPILLLDDEMEKCGQAIDFSVINCTESIVNTSKDIETFCESNDFTLKQKMVVSLAIEEILLIVMDKCFVKDRYETVDLRLFQMNEAIGLRFRYGGISFNPLAFIESDDDFTGEMMGIKMIVNLAETVNYTRTFGTNTLFIML